MNPSPICRHNHLPLHLLGPALKRRISLLGLAGGIIVPAVGQPEITTQPLDRFAVWGDNVTFRVSATGVEPLSYQWRFGERALPGRTQATLTLTNVTFADAGGYSVEVGDATGTVASRVAVLDVPAPGTLDGRVSANIRLGDDPAALPANRRAQVDSRLVRSFRDPTLLVSVFQDGRFDDGGAAALGYGISTDGGLTWARRFVSGLTAVDGGIYQRISWPMAALDLEDRPALCTVVSLQRSAFIPAGIGVSIASGSDIAFAGMVRVEDGNPPQMNDPRLAINDHPNTPTSGRYVALWDSRESGVERLRMTYSDDRGQTWAPPVFVGPRGGWLAQPFFLPDGSLVVVFARGDTGLRSELMRAADGGTEFSQPLPVASLAAGQIYEDPVAESSFNEVMVTADRQTGTLYATYQALTGTAPDRKPQILFIRSSDRGWTWSPPVAVNDTDTRYGGGVFNPCIAVSPDGQHVTIAFYDKRHNRDNTGGNLVDFFLAESFDGGETWEPNLRLSQVSSDLRKASVNSGKRFFGYYHGIVPALGLGVPGVATWIDTRVGNPDPFAVRITRTRGTTFETWRKLRYTATQLANPAISGAEADQDGDGLPNLLEYVLGSEPNSPDRSPFQIHHSGDSHVSVSFQHLNLCSDIAGFQFLTSTNLRDWQSAELVGGNPHVANETGDPAKDETTAVFSVAEGPHFFRLGVSRK